MILNQAADIKLGSTDVDKVYLGTEVVWERNRTEHYGIKIAKDVADPYARVTYTHDAVGFTPAAMNFTTGVFSLGSWANAFFIRKNYPAMFKYDGTEDYRLSKADHAYKEDGVTASDVADLSYGGNAVSVFDCHIWMKFYEDSDYQYVEIANKQLDNHFVDYPYIQQNGMHGEKLFYPMYPGYVDDSNRLRSISGMKASGNAAMGDFANYAANNDHASYWTVSKWQIGDWAHKLWMNCLLLMISKNYDAQAAFGMGNSGVSWTPSEADFKTNGLLNDKGQFFGYNTSADSVKAFYCENIYGNRYEFLLGVYVYYPDWNSSGQWYYRMTPPYTVNGGLDAYSTLGIYQPSEGWITRHMFDKAYGILPNATGGVQGEYVSDWLQQWATYRVYAPLAMGGFVQREENKHRNGPWAIATGYAYGQTSWHYGASLYLKS